METVRIPACNEQMVRESIAKLNKRAEKYGIDSKLELLEVSRDWEQVAAALAGGPVGQVEMVNLTLEGEPPEIKGYRCLATLEVIEGDCYVHPLTSAEVPSIYRNKDTAKDCEHCGMQRNRNETFLLEREGSLIQVGSTCLEDFTGSDKAKLFAQWARIIVQVRKVIKEAQQYDPSTMVVRHQSQARGPQIETFLANCVRIMRHAGAYHPRSSSMSTADHAWSSEGVAPEEDMTKGLAVLSWVRDSLGSRQDEALSDYEHNLVAACRHDHLNNKLKYLVASAVTAFNRDTEKVVYQKGYIGETGKLHQFKAKVVGTFFFRGAKQVVKFIDLTGKAVVYFANTPDVFHVGKNYRFHARVTKHDTFRGVDTTTVRNPEKVEEICVRENA